MAKLLAQGAPACPSINAGSPVTICQGACTTLTSTVVPNNQTSSYSVSAIPYAPYPLTGSSILVGADDVWSGTVNLGFNFCYFGNFYNQAVLGDNGELTFDLSNSGGYDGYVLSTTLPNTTDLPGNTICATFRDMDQGLGGNSYIQTLGVFPCRELVMSWVNVPLFDKGSGICDGTPNSTVQLVLYENTNYIDVYIQNSFSCPGWNGGTGIVGIQNAAGNVAVCPPGRNFPGAWTANNEAWRFSPTGAPSYAITWTGPSGIVGTGASVSVCPATSATYTATMKVTNCDGGVTSYFNTVPVTVTPTTQVVVAPTSSSICNGGGGVALTASNSTTYAWSPAGGLSGTTGANVTANPGATTTYTVTGSVGLCTTVATTVVNVGNAATPTTTPTNILCHGGATGSIVANPTGGNLPYTYSWSPIVNGTNTASGLIAGTYTVAVTTNIGCKSNSIVTLTQPSALAAAPSTVPSTCGGSNGTATPNESGGTPLYGYAWSPAPATGQLTATSTGLPANTYTAVVTDSKGCSQTSTMVVSTVAGPSTVASLPGNVSCNASCNGTATVTGSGGTGLLTYSWSGNPSTSSTASSLCAGTYTCTVKDGNGCISSKPVTITQPAALVVVPTAVAATCGGSNGQASANATGGNGGNGYVWSPAPAAGQTLNTATGLPSNTYTVVVTDSKNCTTSGTVIVNNNGAPTVSLSASANLACNATCTGTATVSAVGGTAPLTYSWSPNVSTTVNATGLCANTTYTCFIKDFNGCQSTQTVILTQPPALSIAPGTTNASCNGTCDGTALATPSGGTGSYAYSWTPNISLAASASGLCLGTYTCYVTDANSCSVSLPFSISQPTALADIPSQTNALCNTACNGTASVNVSGGSGGYVYSWNPNISVISNASALCAGNYTCYIKDSQGCLKNEVFMISEPTPLSLTDNSTAATCKTANGSMMVIPAGGTPGYTYTWTPAPASGQTGATASGLPSNLYTCTIHDTAGCSTIVTDSVKNVGMKPVASLNAGSSATFCFGNSDTLTASGGTSYLWGNGSSSNPYFATLGGLYTVYVSNSCGMDSAKITVIEDSLPRSSITGLTKVCSGKTTPLTASGGGTYLWSTGSTAASIQAGTAGSYYVVVKNLCGTDTANFNLIVNSVTAGIGSSVTVGMMPLPVVFNDSSSANATTWSWNFGDGQTTTTENATYTYPAGGVYTVILIVTEPNGCRDSITEVIDVKELPSWIIVPNVFTPNGDGQNDLFLVRSQGIIQFDAKIYDRWGVEMAQLTAPNMGWDGHTSGGEPAVAGTYYFIIHAKGDDGKSYDFQNFIMLIRN
jgi:gliding motility-associated-like protein